MLSPSWDGLSGPLAGQEYMLKVKLNARNNPEVVLYEEVNDERENRIDFSVTRRRNTLQNGALIRLVCRMYRAITGARD